MKYVIRCKSCYNEFTVSASEELGNYPMCDKCTSLVYSAGVHSGSKLGSILKRFLESLTGFLKLEVL